MLPKPAPTPSDRISTLARELENRFCLMRGNRLEALCELIDISDTLRAGFIVGPKLQIAEYYEFEPAIFIYDGSFGTIGLVEELIAAGGAETTLKRELLEKIDRAANVRQLLLLNADEVARHTAKPVSTITVELVLVIDGAPKANERDPIGTTLQHIARDTAYFQSIGVNVLFHYPKKGFERDDLRRAFPWLLADTNRWFQKNADRIKNSGLQASLDGTTPWSVSLKNYRLGGIRRFDFRENCRLHLLHGHNGSGKSSFSEAMELLLTGKIERLEDAEEQDYFKVVCHRPAQHPHEPSSAGSKDPPAGEASVTLTPGSVNTEQKRHKDSSLSVTLTRHGKAFSDGASPSSHLVASSFRLDQKLMDKLTRSSEIERAELFLRAYFPKDSHLFEKRDELRKGVESTLTRLPSWFYDANFKDTDRDLEKLMNALRFTQPQKKPQTPSSKRGFLETIEPCLPLPASQMVLLKPLSSKLDNILQRWETDPPSLKTLAEELGKVDEAMNKLVETLPDTIKYLETTRLLLLEFKDWVSARRPQRGKDYQTDLDAWLELRALADLIAKYRDVAATFEAARSDGWRPRPERKKIIKKLGWDQKFVWGKDEVKALRDAADQLNIDLGKARDRLDAWSKKQIEDNDTADGPSGKAPPRTTLTDREIIALNRAGAWLFQVQSHEPDHGFGNRFRKALLGDEPVTAGTIRIGSSGGLNDALNDTASLLDVCKKIDELKEPSDLSTLEYFRQAQASFKALESYRDSKQALADAFFLNIAKSELNDALNELLALFKPARWAYEDINLDAGDTETRRTLGLKTRDEERAELRLNTAELNAFTLALFLLCAPLVSNPLRLLILDDPLQNMDELTVTTLSRGLSKLLRIYPQGWQIVALFHGEENMEHIREETPCEVYHLPWLKPMDPGNDDLTIEALEMKSTSKRCPQKLRTEFLCQRDH